MRNDVNNRVESHDDHGKAATSTHVGVLLRTAFGVGVGGLKKKNKTSWALLLVFLGRWKRPTPYSDVS